MNRKRLVPLFGLSLGVVIYACTAETPTASEGDFVFAVGPAPKIDICHYSEEDGTYHMINVSANAESAHRAHGDGQVGDPVPGREGFEFDENCDLTRMCLTPPDMMVSWWPGDADASDIHDGNDGTMMNGATAGMAGKVDGAFSFDGFNDYVEVPDAASLDITGALTIDAWLKVDVIPNTYQTVVLKDSERNRAAYHPYSIFLYPNGQLGFFMGDGAHWSSYYGIATPTPLEAGPWYHVAAVYDGDAQIIYINGQPVATREIGSITLHQHDKPLRIGRARELGIWYYPFHGLMDEIELFDRGLSAEEIEAIYEADSVGKCKP